MVSTHCLMLILKARKRTFKRSFLGKKTVSPYVPHLPYEKLCDDLLCGDNMTAAVGRSPETEHSMSNWIKLFFHIWVGVKEGGRQTTRECKWEASVLIIDGYWLPALTDGRKCGFYADSCQSCTCTAAFIKHYIWEEEEVKRVYTLRVSAPGTHAMVVKSSRK